MTAALRLSQLIGEFFDEKLLLRLLLARGGARSGVSFPVPIVVLRRTDEADTYKVVGYVRLRLRLRVRVPTGWRGRQSMRDPPMGRSAGQDPLRFAGQRDDAEPRITED